VVFKFEIWVVAGLGVLWVVSFAVDFFGGFVVIEGAVVELLPLSILSLMLCLVPLEFLLVC
jgi:hypothetical protein